MNPNQPTHYDNQPRIALTGPKGFAPLVPINQQQQQIYQPPIIQQQNRPYRWYNPTVVGPPGIKPPKSFYTMPLIWSIINAVLFFPFLIWIQALYFSVKTLQAYKSENFREASRKSKTATIINVLCTLFGKLFY